VITVYGIRQCDTCRKALKWLDETGVEHQFHDLRTDGLDVAMLRRWFDSPFRDALVNRRSTTWRGLTEAEKASAGEALVTLLLAHPTLVKRPVFEKDGQVVAIGFRPAAPPELASA
jgi:arsenate reductase